MANAMQLPDSDQFRATLAKYGITPAEIKEAPVPITTPKSGFDELCVQTYPVYSDSDHTQLIENDGHTGPIVFLTMENRDGNEYADYDGFHLIRVLVPDKGEQIVTVSRSDDNPSDLSLYLADLKPGNVFQVARMRTRKKYRLFIPIPVQ